MKHVLLAIALVAPTQISAQKYPIVDPLGHIYLWEGNENGAVLQTKYPVPICENLETKAYGCREGKVTIYVGNNCDAFSPEWGKGTWDWGSSGWGINLENHDIFFLRANPVTDNDGGCWAR